MTSVMLEVPLSLRFLFIRKLSDSQLFRQPLDFCQFVANQKASGGSLILMKITAPNYHGPKSLVDLHSLQWAWGHQADLIAWLNIL